MRNLICTSVLLVLIIPASICQNIYNKWCFGQSAGIGFGNSLPTQFPNAILTDEGCASISDSQGNLLFYTDGTTIYTSSHSMMANGTGLSGGGSSTQSALIEKMPGSANLYYVFTVGQGGTGELRYSVVNINLAAGSGSVVVKNIFLSDSCGEKLTATKHCNGSEIWIVSHDMDNNRFKSFLLGPTGLNTVPVISDVGSIHSGFEAYGGSMKISPNGKRIAVAVSGTSGFFEMLQFNNTNGVVSNPLRLVTLAAYAYGVEFSPDGSKLYGCRVLSQSIIFQWNLCAPDTTTIKNSVYQQSHPAVLGTMQLASDGKIYVARHGSSRVAVIGSPGLSGQAMAFNLLGPSVAPGICYFGLPNFNTSELKFNNSSMQFHMLSCDSVLFHSPYSNFQSSGSCNTNATSIVSYSWNFGDPASGSSNTSTLQSPVHKFQSQGNYTVQLILYYPCNRIDTLLNTIQIQNNCLPFAQVSINCWSFGSATISPSPGSPGALTCTWTPGNLVGNVQNSLVSGTYTVTIFNPNLSQYSTLSVVVPNFASLGDINLQHELMVSCYGAQDATAAVLYQGSPLSGYSVLWSNGGTTYTTPVVNQLSAGLWLVTVYVPGGSCVYTNSFYIDQPSPLTVSVLPSAAGVCAGSTVTFTAFVTGGQPFSNGVYSYSWTGGSGQNPYSPIVQGQGINLFSVLCTDSLGCTGNATIAVSSIPLPTLSVSNITICPSQQGILVASGASSYTWNGLVSGSTYSLLGSSSQTILLSGTSGQCTSTLNAFVYVFPVLQNSLGSNSPLCENQNLHLTSTASAISYSWSGPGGFNSAIQNPILLNCQVQHSGIYSLELIDLYGCSYTSSLNVWVGSNPTLNVPGSFEVCVQHSFQFEPSQNPNWSYQWSGPGYSGSNAALFFPVTQLSHAGVYSLTVTDSINCHSSYTFQILVDQPPQLIVQTTDICIGHSGTLQVSGATTYTWLAPGNLTYIGSSCITPPSLALGLAVYTVWGSNPSGCINHHTLSITTYSLPTPVFTVTQELCEKNNIVLYADGGQYVNWQGPQNFYCSLKQYTVYAGSSSFSGNYTLNVTDSYGCIGSTIVPITVYALPILNAEVSRNRGCIPFCVVMHLDTTHSGELHDVVWSSVSGNDQGLEFKACFDKAGMNEIYVEASNKKNCRSQQRLVVDAIEPPIADFSFSPEKPVEGLDDVRFTNLSKGESIQDWEWGINPDLSNPVAYSGFDQVFYEAGNYLVFLVVKNKWGCSDTIARTLTVFEDKSIYVPNAFTPNADGLNDSFYPVLYGKKIQEMSVYNRWGEMVFLGKDKDCIWDGRHKGELCQQDVYNYRIVLMENDGENRNLVGSVLLYR